ncbi:hypothetical protein L1N85_01970 [Paenibacillus alkaliterrae]|uniref:hypothetical protein n=1 Tax=Paenibacillus alkaliterrae TaxID=320909 RepID=UPI001F26FF47|nr:hypothetical protein [Paenibacillus alkaliterrae]MCF2937195.1 hypothetical protein [Paenibacillus alkaliterrae]
MKPDQLNVSKAEKQPNVFNNLNHTGTSYVQNAIENAQENNSIHDEAAANLVKQVLQNKKS